MKIKRIFFVFLFCMLCVVPSSFSYAKTTIPNWARSGKISHAGGGIQNTSYTNSLEALSNTLNNKQKVVELDFKFTKDGTLVCIHSWKDINGKSLKKSAFLSSKIKKNFTPMTAETALNMLIKSGNTYLVVDAKEKDVAKVYEEINRICLNYDKTQNEAIQEAAEQVSVQNSKSEPENSSTTETATASSETNDTNQITPCKKGSKYRKKIIPQLYSKSEYKQLKKIYNYKNWIFTVYKLKMTKESDFKSLATFCKKNNIQTVTVPKKALTKNIVKILHKKNLTVATHTINSSNEYNIYQKMGVNVIYTDFLQ